MTPVTPKLQDGEIPVVFAKGQVWRLVLPAVVSSDFERLVSTEWELTTEELAALFVGGRIRLSLMTFGHPLQPIILSVVPGDPLVMREAVAS